MQISAIILAAISLAALPVRSAPIPDWAGTDTDGQELAIFKCPDNSFIKTITGNAGKYLDRIKFECNDEKKTKSGLFGTANDERGRPYIFNQEEGFKEINVRAKGGVESINIGGVREGGDGGEDHIFKFDCPINEAHARFKTGEKDTVKGLQFFATCANTSAVKAEETSSTPASSSPSDGTFNTRPVSK